MGVWSQFKQLILPHLLIGYIFLASGFIVNILMLCTCILWPFSKSTYRKITHYLAYSHWSQYTAIAHWWANCDMELVTASREDGDKLLKYVGTEHAVVIMNHKYDIDWLIGYMIIERMKYLGGSKIYGKEPLRYVPIQGWNWVFTESIFLKRDWKHDKEILTNNVAKYSEYPRGYNVNILVFPEGTRFTEDKHKTSMEVAKQKQLPQLKHHLLPRTKGFVTTVRALKGKLAVIYDTTVAFTPDSAEPTLMSILYGRRCTAQMYFRRYLIDEIPTDTDEACSEWLYKLFEEKDALYETFVQKGSFDGVKTYVPRRWNDLLMYIFWAVLTCMPLFYYLSMLFRAGTLLQQVIFLLGVAAATVGLRMMISVAETHKGSSYGGKSKGS